MNGNLSILSGTEGVRTLTETVGAVAVVRDVLTAVGADSAKFLQSQLSQDISGLEIGASTWSFLLQPTGKLVGFFRVTRTADDAFRLDGDAGIGEGIETALRRFLIRTKCTISLAVCQPMWAVRGPNSSATAMNGGVSCFPTLQGFDVFDGELPNGVMEVAPECLEYVRISAGVPMWPYELNEATIPNATGFVSLGVSFSKGCYVGQELVERIDSRGTITPRLLRRVRFDAPGTDLTKISVGSDIFHLTATSETAKGVVTSRATDPFSGDVVVLAYIHRGIDEGSNVHVGSSVGVVSGVGIASAPDPLPSTSGG